MCNKHKCSHCVGEAKGGVCFYWGEVDEKCSCRRGYREGCEYCEGRGKIKGAPARFHCHHCCECQKCTQRKNEQKAIMQTQFELPHASAPVPQEQHVLVTPATGGVQNSPGVPHSTQTLSAINLDEKLQKVYAVRSRPGQAKFRKEVLLRCNQRCVVTGCDTIEVLEAAHIVPFSDSNPSDQENPKNGIALRADVHTLFDLNLLYVHWDGANLRWALDSNVTYLDGVRNKDCDDVFVDNEVNNFLKASGRAPSYF